MTVNVTFLLPALDQEMVCGPITLELLTLAPIPKFQENVAPGKAVPVYVNVEFDPIHTLDNEFENVDVGAAFILIVLVDVELQVPFATVNETVLDPVLDHETECGPKPVAEAGLAFAPKLQV